MDDGEGDEIQFKFLVIGKEPECSHRNPQQSMNSHPQRGYYKQANRVK